MSIPLQVARVRAGYTQQMLADVLGVTRQAVSEWERGLSMPDVITGQRIARELDVDLDTLVFGIRDKGAKRRGA